MGKVSKMHGDAGFRAGIQRMFCHVIVKSPEILRHVSSQYLSQSCNLFIMDSTKYWKFKPAVQNKIFPKYATL
jgi:hypothetical protein